MGGCSLDTRVPNLIFGNSVLIKNSWSCFFILLVINGWFASLYGIEICWQFILFESILSSNRLIILFENLRTEHGLIESSLSVIRDWLIKQIASVWILIWDDLQSLCGAYVLWFKAQTWIRMQFFHKHFNGRFWVMIVLRFCCVPSICRVSFFDFWITFHNISCSSQRDEFKWCIYNSLFKVVWSYRLKDIGISEIFFRLLT